MTATQITAALRACAAGFYAEEAGTELLISHGGFLDRPGLIRFVDTFASAHDGARWPRSTGSPCRSPGAKGS